LPKSVSFCEKVKYLSSVLTAAAFSDSRTAPNTALEYVPNSVKLWRSIVSLEDNPEDARILLARAVELNKYSVELWLALARVETPDKARAVLNKARKAIPTSHEIWIAASRLQEQEGSIDQVDALIVNAVASLRKNGAELSREEWLREAKKCEANGSIVTCQAIVKATIFLEIDEEDRLTTWLSDVEACEGDRLDGDDRDPANQPESWIAVRQKGHIETARAILSYTLTVFRNDRRAWKRAVDFEKAHGSR
jgi:pre-mRNA-processing factor 6